MNKAPSYYKKRYEGIEHTVIISAFPGCGKTYAYENYDEKYVIADSDSSEFSWIKDQDGNNTKVRNPEFPNNYIEHIVSLIGKVDILFVSSHESVRTALAAAEIPYTVVIPGNHIEIKELWLQRLRDRGSADTFVQFISDNWEAFNNDIWYKETFPAKFDLYTDYNANVAMGNYTTEESAYTLSMQVLDEIVASHQSIFGVDSLLPKPEIKEEPTDESATEEVTAENTETVEEEPKTDAVTEEVPVVEETASETTETVEEEK